MIMRIPVSTIMTRDIYAVAPDTSIETAARLLSTQHISGAPVVNGHEVGDDVNLSEGRVADIMSPFVLSIDAAASLVEAATLMLSENVHRLLVMDGRKLVGIVTTTDLLRGFVNGAR
jgi:CBS domain-containing protein